MKIAAAIFDLNGTILDDERNYDTAFNKVLADLGVDTTSNISHERGIGVKENWTIYRAKFNFKTDKSDEELAVLTQAEYLKHIDGISVRPGFENFVEDLKDSGVRVGLATSNTWEVAMKVLEQVNLVDVFDTITTTEEVILNKPDPGIFLVAADKLGVERYECLVIEDAQSGIEAAHRAGMKVIVIAPDGDHQKLSGADLIVGGFPEITPKVIDQL